jgi:hypothetical protein
VSAAFGSLTVRAGPRAAAHIRRVGLSPAHVACVPAAAGGPKGLALIPLDQRLFGDWLQPAAEGGSAALQLIGASIGAWRMFAAARDDAVAALGRLADAYIAQTYPRDPTPAYVSTECRRLARVVLGTDPELTLARLRRGIGLTLVAARSRGALQGNGSRRAFAVAALANARSRRALARHLQRVAFTAGDSRFPAGAFDAFGLLRVPLSAANAEDALLATGSIPLICEPVRTPAGAPAGDYWDGGLIDYHLLLPYPQLDGIVLYPHFAPHVTPGWLDKFLPWRRRPRAHPWLDNVLLIAPSPALLARLPNGKLPDRSDFRRYGLDHARRQRDWRRAMAECERFADEAMTWLARPDPAVLRPL